ncbi:hypothetical protein FQN57_007278 [Myotisia sp. PD_48]|nr:hypothetical protein FQN57_007278 [Myotisia sp. PD_48]
MAGEVPREATPPTEKQLQNEEQREPSPSATSRIKPKEKGNPPRDSGRDNEEKDEEQNGRSRLKEERESKERDGTSAPPLPDEDIPPLPNEPVPGETEDDGWDAMWDDNAQAYYFYNRLTGISQWTNPRVPDPQAQIQQPGPPGVTDNIETNGSQSRATGGYDPSIHGDYDPNAWYAQKPEEVSSASIPGGLDPTMMYTATGTFNRFTGKWQPADIKPENFSVENKSQRQLSTYFDVDAAANSHEGKSLKAERSGKRLSKKELKAFKDKRREKKEERRRAWLLD